MSHKKLPLPQKLSELKRLERKLQREYDLRLFNKSEVSDALYFVEGQISAIEFALTHNEKEYQKKIAFCYEIKIH